MAFGGASRRSHRSSIGPLGEAPVSMFFSRSRPRRSAARRGFSLVELLVVSAIIGLLVGLVLMVSLRVVGAAQSSVRYVSQQTMDVAAISDTPLHVPAPPPPTSSHRAE